VRSGSYYGPQRYAGLANQDVNTGTRIGVRHLNTVGVGFGYAVGRGWFSFKCPCTTSHISGLCPKCLCERVQQLPEVGKTYPVEPSQVDLKMSWWETFFSIFGGNR